MKAKKWIFILLGVLLVLIIGLYIYQVNFFKQHYLPQSTANGIDISQMTYKEAEKSLTEQSAKETFDILDNGQVWKQIPTSELGMEYNYSKDLKKIMDQQNSYLWFTSYFSKHKHDLKDTSVNEENLKAFSDSLVNEIGELNKGRTVSANATIKKNDQGFEIIPEIQGNNIEAAKVVENLKEQLTTGKENLELEEFIAKPSVTADNADLKKNLAEVSRITDQQVNYLINGENVAVPKAEIANWIDYDQANNQVALDKEKIRAYVANIGAQYNTSTNPTKFKSTARGEVSVPAGSYSWTIQTDTETDTLYEELLKGEGVNRSPVAQGSASISDPLIGNTYVEVDLQNQHMYYYRDGKVFLETDVVTGKPTTPTPAATNYVWKKERNSTLRGTNDDGSKYAEPVDYWMPIDWTGVGLHDSPWQPAYGGSLWQTVGSHGCVNTPPDVAAKLYEAIEVGTPVLVF